MVRYHLRNGMWVARGRNDRLPSLGPAGRKTGPNYVRYEDLYVPGDDLQQTLNRVTGNKVMTFPNGTFIIPSDFRYGYMDGIRVGNGGATNCNGISGSGPGTIFKMLSSNRPQPNYGAFEANNFFLMQANGENWAGGRRPGMEFSNFHLQGTQLGADVDHNGLRFQDCLDLLVEDVLVTGIKGSDAIPPGETGSISLHRNTGGLIRRVELDGRRDGVKVSSALLMPNNGSDLTVEDSYLHHTRYGGGGIAWYIYNGGIVRNVRSHYIGSGTGKFSGYSFNHEQAQNIVYYNPDMIADRDATGGGGTLHMSLNSDSARGGVDNILTVHNPKWDPTSVGNGRFVVHTWDLGANQVQRTKPRVYDAQGNPLDFFYILPAQYGAPIIR